MTYNRPQEVIKKDDTLLSYYLAAQIANYLARLAWHSKNITPNLFTTLSFICGITTAVIFSFGNNYKSLVIGCCTLIITLIFDCADGQTARLQGKTSQWGHWYDYHTDKIKDIALLIGLAYGSYLLNHNEIVFIFAFIGISFQFLRNITRLNRINFEIKNNLQEKNNTTNNQDNKQFFRVIKNSLMFKEADRYLLFIIFALANQILLMLLIYAILEFCYAVYSAYLNYKLFKKYA